MLSDITYTWLLQKPPPLFSPIGLCHCFYASTTLFCSECGLLMAPRCSLLWGIALNQGIHCGGQVSHANLLGAPLGQRIVNMACRRPKPLLETELSP